MPETDRKLSAQEAEAIRARVNQWMRANAISQERLAARLEISKTVISEVLRGSYRADPSRHLLALDEVSRTAEPRDLVGPEVVSPVRTSTVINMESIVEAARRIGTCAMIWGPSGAGKTTYARARALEKSSCVYVNLTGKGYTPSRLLRHIARDMRLVASTLDYRNNPDLLHNRICAALSGLSRVLFIDNAHLLNKDCLWCLHAIHDDSGAIVVCIGQPALWHTVKASRADAGIGATVYARFGLKLDLSAATSARVDPTTSDRLIRPERQWLHTVEDVKKFLESRRIKFHPGALAWLHKLANCPTYGGFHELDDIVAIAERYYPGETLTLDVLAQIDAVIRPPDDQQAIRDRIADLRPAAAAAG